MCQNNSQTVMTAHNQFLEYLYLGGIICIAFIVILYVISKKEIKNYYRDKNVQLTSLAFFTFLIISLTEVFLNPLMFIVFLKLDFTPR